MKIKNSFLMWVGTSHYPTIDSYVQEAIKLGVSKRLSNPSVAQTLMQEGTVVFLAHDEGEYLQCKECWGLVECMDCLMRDVKVRKLEKKIDEMAYDFSATAKRINLQVKINNLINDFTECVSGNRHINYGGTGGYVEFKNSERLTYVEYLYYVKQPSLCEELGYSKKNITNFSKCSYCGGFGKVSNTKVFGYFVPDRFEYIAKQNDLVDYVYELKDRGFEIQTAESIRGETKRGCGYRKVGATYVLTKPFGTFDIEAATEVIGAIGRDMLKDDNSLDVHGSFVHFKNPIYVSGLKRFRGVKRWFPEILKNQFVSQIEFDKKVIG